MTLQIDEVPGGVCFPVKVVPNSSRDAVVGLLGHALKVKVARPPEGGQANRAVTQLLARALGVAATRVSVVAGHGQPHKRVQVLGVSPAGLRAALLPA